MTSMISRLFSKGTEKRVEAEERDLPPFENVHIGNLWRSLANYLVSELFIIHNPDCDLLDEDKVNELCQEIFRDRIDRFELYNGLALRELNRHLTDAEWRHCFDKLRHEASLMKHRISRKTEAKQ